MELEDHKKTPIVIYRLGSLGDTVVALPCFHKISESFPNREKIVLTNIPISSKAAAIESILSPSTLIDRVIEYPLKIRSLLGIFRLRKKLLETKSTTLIYLNASRGRLKVFRDICFFRFCGFTEIIGAPTNSDLLNCRVDAATGLIEPEAKRLIRNMSALGDINPEDIKNWDLLLSTHEREIAISKLSSLNDLSFFAINMGGKHISKDWGNKNWSELVSKLALIYPLLGLVVVGVREDAERAEQVLKLWPNLKINFCGIINPRECAAVLEKSLFFIGHDSGPLHLAAAVNVKCIGLFGKLNKPKRWHPLGSNHQILHSVKGVQMISVQTVVMAVLKVISGNRSL